MPRIERRGNKRIYRKGPMLLAGVGAVFFIWGVVFQISIASEVLSGSQNFTINDRPASEASPAMRGIAVAFPALFWGLGLLPMLYYFLARVVTDEFGIADYGLFGFKKGEARWEDVTQLTMERRRFGGSTAVLETHGKPIKIPVGMPGWPLLRAEVARRLGKDLGREAAKSSVRRPAIAPLSPKGRTFRPANRIPTLFFFSIWNAFCGFMLLMLLLSPGSLAQKWMFFPCIGSFLALGLGFWIWAWNARVVVSEEGIAQYDLFNRADALSWGEVEGYELESKTTGEHGTTRTYVVRGEDRFVRVGDEYFKWRELDDTILSRLPHSAVVDRTEPD